MANPSRSLVSQKSSDSGLHIQLHPLILLTISDHITRHAARSQQGPIIGALLGQQNGPEITLEHAFECNIMYGPNGEVLFPRVWFEERVRQFKDVHKVPALDLVGWWSTAPPSGPNASHLPIHQQLLQDYNESAVFLAFHPSQLQSPSENGAKLPLTIYESVYEGENVVVDGDKEMQVDGEEQALSIRFRELPYSIETGDAEMIGVDFVARGGGNATVVEPRAHPESVSGKKKKKDHGGVAKGLATEEPVATVLSPEEEDLIATLNTRLNAIRTLESRISLIKSYLSTLSANANTTATTTTTTTATQPEPKQPSSTPSISLSHPTLRNINSLISHLSLLNPQDQTAFTTETLAQSNDVALVSVLGQLGQNVKAMRELGRKSAIVQSARQSARKSQMGMGMGRQRGYEEEFLRGV